jgi:hypothetical protein
METQRKPRTARLNLGLRIGCSQWIACAMGFEALGSDNHEQKPRDWDPNTLALVEEGDAVNMYNE